MLAQNIKRIFEGLDEESVRILSIVASKGEMTSYEVWKESKQRGREIPQRTVYGKIHWLTRKDRSYLVETKKEKFKIKLRKVYYDVTLKGMLAALSDENFPFSGVFLDRLRTRLHIPEKFDKAVRPIVSIWAHCESNLKTERRKIDERSIFLSVLEAIAASEQIGIYSVLREESKLPDIVEFQKTFGITDDEYDALSRFLSSVVAFKFPESFELNKRTLYFATGMAPAPYISDLIEILPDVGIRVFWTTSKSFDSLSLQDSLLWLYGHRDIADLVSKGDQKNLNEYLSEFISKLHPSWLLTCFRRELDGICSLKGTGCSFPSPLDCDIVREHAKAFQTFLDVVIKKLLAKLDHHDEKHNSTN